MSDSQQPPQKVSRERSPSFPFIPLKTAIDRLQEFEGKFGRNPPPADRVYLAWGYKGDTSQSQQTLAALKAFGLVEYGGSGPKRSVTMSEDARIYLRANQDAIKASLLKKLALKPVWIARMWSQWGRERHPDEVCLDELVLKHKFTENAASLFLRVYDESISYAELSDSDKISPNADDDSAGNDFIGKFQIGDFVNWESGGQIQWKQPRKIIGVDGHDDGHLFYEVEGVGELAGQKGWIPIEQAIQHQPSPQSQGGLFTPPPSDPISNTQTNGGVVVKEGTRKAVFPVEDGDVTLIFPEAITKAGLEELGQYLEIFLKKEQKKKSYD